MQRGDRDGISLIPITVIENRSTGSRRPRGGSSNQESEAASGGQDRKERRMNLPTIRQLEYALALGDTLSFSKAAQACHVTQPALSAQIKLLEDLLRIPLFERDRRRVILTEDGVSLLKQARRVVAEARTLVEIGRSVRPPLSGSLCMGAIPTVAPYVLPAVFGRMGERFPEVELHLREEIGDKLIDRLASGDLDVLLLPLETLPPKRYTTLELFEDRFVVAVPADHPLAEREFVSGEELCDESVLMLAEGHCVRDQALALCREFGVRSYDTHRAGSLTTLVRMVGSGLGVTLLPEVAVDLETSRETLEGVALVQFAQPSPKRTIGLAWRSGSPRARDFELLGSEIQETWIERTS